MACATLKRPFQMDSVHSPGGRPSKRRRYGVGSPSDLARDEPRSPFSEAALTARLTPDQIRQHIKAEMGRLHRRKQLTYDEKEETSPCTSGPSSPNGGHNAVANFNLESAMAIGSSADCSKQKEKAIFTFRQVGLICERMLREQEDHLRSLFEQVLIGKMAEQYDTFVKFTHDQIRKRLEDRVPSYLS